MFCVRCGNSLRDDQQYCPGCGQSVAGVPLMPAQSRLAGHLRLLGILWICVSVFRLIPGVFLLFLAEWPFAMNQPDVPPFLPALFRALGTLVLGGGLIGVVAGGGLLARQSWARLLSIVIGCLFLIDMPIGTALGAYTLWTLLPARSEEEYRQMAEAAPQPS